VSGLTGSCVDGLRAAQGNFSADAARLGADMCPAYLTRRAWPLALMRSADRVPINSAGFETPPHYRVLPILGHNRISSAPFTPRDPPIAVRCYAATAIGEFR
jgi:hypothetical protein